MTVRVVTIVPGTETEVGDGVTGPVRALVRFEDGTIGRAIVKRLSPEGLAAEVFCSYLLRAWGLQVPESAIVAEQPLAFASLDVSYPNLKQRLGWSESLPEYLQSLLLRQGAHFVATLKDTPLALAADEAIENFDRNFGNILWDGADAAWIDHERAFGLSGGANNNLLAYFVNLTPHSEKVQTAAVAISLTLGPQAVDAAISECGTHCDASTFAKTVSAGLTSLGARVIKRFPEPDDLLKEAQ